MVLIAILSAVSYNGIIGARNHSRLSAATDTVVGVIQTARSYALSNMEIEISDTESCEALSYEVEFDSSSTPNTITIFANLSDDCSDRTATLIEESLSEEITLDIRPSAPPSNIVYTPPLAEVSFDPDIVAPDYFNINITTENADLYKVVDVYQISGFPEVTH